MELHEALSQISEIRQQMARSQVFRGYRSATTAFTALVAAGAAGAQALWVPDPSRQVTQYLLVWCGAALVGLVVVGTEMALRSHRSGSPLQRQFTLLAVDQFMPAIVAGGLLTLVIEQFAREAVWMLPGLWAILFSLGVFASRRFLPRGVFVIGAYYLLAGLWCLTLDRSPGGTHPALSLWTMGLLFGFGQLLAAGVLWWTLEREHGREE